jgi:hypothetical protein
MKKFLAVILVLAGSLSIAFWVLQKMGKLSPLLKVQAGAFGVIGKADAPAAVFMITKAVPMFFYNLLIRLFGYISALSSVSLPHRAR